jgi:hypothetical protein
VSKIRVSGTPPPYLPARISRPSPEDQIRFIANIERILSEGSFVATYKYALLVALVELAIELEFSVPAFQRRPRGTPRLPA